MTYTITKENLIIVHGGHATVAAITKKQNRDGTHRVVSGQLGPGQPSMGHQRHYPIFKTEDGAEWISLNGQTLVKISDLNLHNSRRETVNRG